MLSNGENYCYSANSMQTKSHIEFHLKDYAKSLNTMIASVNISSIHISQTQADKFREDYAALMKTLEKLLLFVTQSLDRIQTACSICRQHACQKSDYRNQQNHKNN
jgi:hypothetical protein